MASPALSALWALAKAPSVRFMYAASRSAYGPASSRWTFSTKFVATAAGSMTLTLMPNAAATVDSDCMKPSTANLAPQ